MRRLDPKKRWEARFRRDFRKYGKLCESEGLYEKAIESYSFVIQSFREGTSDTWADVLSDYFNRARAYRLKGDFDHAIADINKCIELYPQFHLGRSWSYVAAYYKCRAQIHYERRDCAEAIMDLEEAIQRDPRGTLSIVEGQCRFNGPYPNEEGWKHKEAMATLASLYAQAGDFDLAIQHQKTFVQLPDITVEERAEGRRAMSTSLLMHSRHIVRWCPVCGRPLHIGVHLFGQTVTCGHCRGRFTASDSDDLSGGLTARVDRLLGARTRFAARTARSIRSGALSGNSTAGDCRGLGRVPAVRPRQYSAPETAHAAVCAFPGKLKEVFLVEHRDEVFARLAADLASIQLQVTRALNASAASRRFAACPSVLMIANVDLPDESGWLLAAKLRLVYPTARIWLYTAHPSALDRDRARYLDVARLIHYGGDLLRLAGKALNRPT